MHPSGDLSICFRDWKLADRFGTVGSILCILQEDAAGLSDARSPAQSLGAA